MLLIQRSFTKYDDTDELKRMNDSDILAEKPKSNRKHHIRAAERAVEGGAIGGATGAALALLLRRKSGLTLKQAAILGASAGASVGAGISLKRSKKERKDNHNYNERLRDMKYQAKRREKRDWRNHLTGREEYSYR